VQGRPVAPFPAHARTCGRGASVDVRQRRVGPVRPVARSL